MITLRWAPQDRAKAYNVYADHGSGLTVANPIPVSSRTQYSFLWAHEAGEKRRVVLGNRVRLHVVALDGEGCPEDPKRCVEGAQSATVITRYFEGFSSIVSEKQVKSVLQSAQSSPRILDLGERNTRREFIARYPGCAARVLAAYRTRIDPRDEGACVPFSTIVAKYLTEKGITCYRAQGRFISRFHSYNIVVVDTVEYILDFTADQFLPSSSPVLIPRDFCFIDSTGAPTRTPHGTVTPMYLAEKVFRPDQIRFTDTDEAGEYRAVLDSLLME